MFRAGENVKHQIEELGLFCKMKLNGFLDGNLNLCNEIISNNIKNITIYNGNVKEFLDNMIIDILK